MALNEFGRRNGFQHIWFPDGNTLPVDGFIVHEGQVAGVFEAKCRNIKYLQDSQTIEYDGKEYDDYMISKSKIDSGIQYAKQFSMKFILLVYCEQSGHILSFRIANESGECLVDFSEKRSRTQATVNGGAAIRTNAYIPVKQAKAWKAKLFIY